MFLDACWFARTSPSPASALASRLCSPLPLAPVLSLGLSLYLVLSLLLATFAVRVAVAWVMAGSPVLLNTCCSGASEHHSTRVMHACSLQVLLTLVHSCFLLHQPIFEEAECCKIGRVSVAECSSYCLGSVPQALFSDHTECMRWCGNAQDLPNDNTTCALGCQTLAVNGSRTLAVNGSRWAYMQCRSACELAPYLPSEHFCAGPCNTTCAQSCAPHAVTASHANYTECMGSCSNITVAIAAISCRHVNNTKPSWCS